MADCARGGDTRVPKQTEYHCTMDADCGSQGICEPAVMFCSFPARNVCRRFSDSAGPYANACVGPAGLDAGVDGPHADASVDAPPAGCPSGYNPVTGLTHVYKVIPASAGNWMTQRTSCAITSSSAYLAIPDDLTELQALDTLSAARYWVGIDDMAVEGTYVTAKGAAATFLPWATGQPDNAMNSDCIAAVSATAQLEDDKCNTTHPRSANANRSHGYFTRFATDHANPKR